MKYRLLGFAALFSLCIPFAFADPPTSILLFDQDGNPAGQMELPPGGFNVDSFFDVYTEITIPDITPANPDCIVCDSIKDEMGRKKVELDSIKQNLDEAKSDFEKAMGELGEAAGDLMKAEDKLKEFKDPQSWAESEGRRVDSSDLEVMRDYNQELWQQYKADKLTADELQQKWNEGLTQEQIDARKAGVQKKLEVAVKDAKKKADDAAKKADKAEKKVAELTDKFEKAFKELQELMRRYQECLDRCKLGPVNIIEDLGIGFEGPTIIDRIGDFFGGLFGGERYEVPVEIVALDLTGAGPIQLPPIQLPPIQLPPMEIPGWPGGPVEFPPINPPPLPFDPFGIGGPPPTIDFPPFPVPPLPLPPIDIDGMPFELPPIPIPPIDIPPFPLPPIDFTPGGPIPDIPLPPITIPPIDSPDIIDPFGIFGDSPPTIPEIEFTGGLDSEIIAEAIREAIESIPEPGEPIVPELMPLDLSSGPGTLFPDGLDIPLPPSPIPLTPSLPVLPSVPDFPAESFFDVYTEVEVPDIPPVRCVICDHIYEKAMELMDQLEAYEDALEETMEDMEQTTDRLEQRKQELRDAQDALDRHNNPRSWAESGGRRLDSSDLEAMREWNRQQWDSYRNGDQTAQDLEQKWRDGPSQQEIDDIKSDIADGLQDTVDMKQDIVDMLQDEIDDLEVEAQEYKDKIEELTEELDRLAAEYFDCLQRCASLAPQDAITIGGLGLDDIPDIPPLPPIIARDVIGATEGIIGWLVDIVTPDPPPVEQCDAPFMQLGACIATCEGGSVNCSPGYTTDSGIECYQCIERCPEGASWTNQAACNEMCANPCEREATLRDGTQCFSCTETVTEECPTDSIIGDAACRSACGSMDNCRRIGSRFRQEGNTIHIDHCYECKEDLIQIDLCPDQTYFSEEECRTACDGPCSPQGESSQGKSCYGCEPTDEVEESYCPQGQRVDYMAQDPADCSLCASKECKSIGMQHGMHCIQCEPLIEDGLEQCPSHEYTAADPNDCSPCESGLCESVGRLAVDGRYCMVCKNPEVVCPDDSVLSCEDCQLGTRCVTDNDGCHFCVPLELPSCDYPDVPSCDDCPSNTTCRGRTNGCYACDPIVTEPPPSECDYPTMDGSICDDTCPRGCDYIYSLSDGTGCYECKEETDEPTCPYDSVPTCGDCPGGTECIPLDECYSCEPYDTGPTCTSGTADQSTCNSQCDGTCADPDGDGCYQCVLVECPGGYTLDSCPSDCDLGCDSFSDSYQGVNFSCYTCKEPALTCDQVCGQNDYAQVGTNWNSYIQSYLNSYVCVSGASISVSKATIGDCTCSNQPSISVDQTPLYCRGTPCGDVECNGSASCASGDGTVTVYCNWGGWENIGENQFVPAAGG